MNVSKSNCCIFQYHTWYFVPDDQEKYVMKPTLIVSGVKLHAKSSGGKKRSFVLRAIGEGSTGQMRVSFISSEDSHVKKSFQPIWILKFRFTRTINVTVFVPIKNGFSAVVSCCLPMASQRSKVPLIKG